MGPLILVAEETLFNRKLIGRVLENNGFKNIAEAATADETMEKFMVKAPDLTILDVNFRSTDETSLLKKLLDIDPEAKVIMSTLAGHPALIAEALDNGAKDFMTKPFVNTEFIKLVRKVIQDV